MDNGEILCLCMMQQDMAREMAWQQWQSSCLTTIPADAYKRLQLYGHTCNNFSTIEYSSSRHTLDYDPLPIYFSENAREKISITREAYSTDGKIQTQFTLKEISKHNFVLHCNVAENTTYELKDKIYSQLDDIFKYIFDDTEYIVAYAKGNIPFLDEILRNYDFKKITEHGDNDTYLLK